MDVKMNKTIDVIGLELSLDKYDQFTLNINNLDKLFFSSINDDLEKQLNYVYYENINDLFKAINNKMFFNDDNRTKQFRIKEYIYIDLNQIFNTKKLIFVNSNKINKQEKEINNWEKDLLNSKDILKKVKSENNIEINKDEFINNVKFQISQHEIKIKKLKAELKSIRKEVSIKNKYLKIKIQELINQFKTNYKIDLNSMENKKFFGLNSSINKFVKNNWEAFSLPVLNKLDFISNISDKFLFYDGEKLLSLNETIKLLQTKHLYLQNKYLNGNISIEFLFNSFLPILGNSDIFNDNFNVFNKLLKEKIHKIIDNNKNLSVFFDKYEKRNNIWENILEEFNNQEDNFVKDALYVFLMKIYLVEFNNTLLVMNELILNRE